MGPNAILTALTDGAMRLQGSVLGDEGRIAVAEFLSGKSVIERPIRFDVGMCEDLSAIDSPARGTVWSGWGSDEKNSRYQTETGGLTAKDIPNLTLQWAFGIPDVTQARAQPAVYGDRVFIGSQAGMIFALDANTGCTYWSFKAEGAVRTAMSVGNVDVDGESRVAVFFNDLKAIAYALDAETGEKLWSHKVDEHFAAMGTGALKHHDGVLYVPTSGLGEEAVANGAMEYQCCSFRGSVTALDANTGEEIWKTYTLPEPKFVKTLESGGELWGPAGVAVWNTPTIDVKRNLLYIGTGNAYSEPEVDISNSIVALDLSSGEIVWINQVLQADIWTGGCDVSLGGNPDNEGCPENVGPDFDFSASPVLTTMANGKDIIVATQKSGLGFAFDPDQGGKLVWTYRWGVGAAAGGVYGTSSDGEKAYFAVADNWTAAPGGLHAVDLMSGERAWFTPPQDLLCNTEVMGCAPTQSAAVTTMPGVVFSGSADGGIRAYSTDTGKVIWLYNTNREFDVVNGIAANGGSLDAAGVVIANGMVYVTSGNGGAFGTPGNVLLAFSVEE